MKVGFLSLVALGSATLIASAQPDERSREELDKDASHIVIGRVRMVFSHAEKTETTFVTRYVLEIEVSDCLKGEGLAKGTVVYAQGWHVKALPGKGPLKSTGGHRLADGGRPCDLKSGTLVRAYLAREADGSFVILLANGIALMRD